MPGQNSAKVSPDQLKKRVAALKKAGLYSGDLRKPVTDYAKRLTRKYADVLSGNAQVVKIPEKTGDTKSAKEARLIARSLAREYEGIVKAKGSRVVVKVLPGEGREKVRYSPSHKTLIASMKAGDSSNDMLFLRNVKLRVNPESKDLEFANLPKLKNGERYVTTYKKGDKIYYAYYASIDDYWRDRMTYDAQAGLKGYQPLDQILIQKKGRIKPARYKGNVKSI